MKEVELFPDDPKSAECIKQLEQVIKIFIWADVNSHMHSCTLI